MNGIEIVERLATERSKVDFAKLLNDEATHRVRGDLFHARHLPAHFYTSQEIYDLEIEKIWMKDWLFVGRVEEFPKPGDYRTMEIAGEAIVITRDEEGKLNTFSNICSHRGAEVAWGAGNAKDFSCPYHAWLYDLKGNLIKAARTKAVEGFDFKNCSLPRIKIDTWGGFIFINFDENSPTLAEFLDADRVREVAEFLRPDDVHLVDTHTFELDCNWKLVPENLIDVYHVEVLHKGTIGREFGTDDFDFRLSKWGWHAYYEAGSNSPDGELMFGPMPWLKDQPRGDLFAFTVFIRPHMNLFARQDHIQPWISYPLGPNRTLVKIMTMIPKAFLKAKAFPEKVKILHNYIDKASGEDAAMLRSMQKNFHSRRFRPGPTTGLEKAIHHRLNRYLDAMAGDGETR